MCIDIYIALYPQDIYIIYIGLYPLAYLSRSFCPTCALAHGQKRVHQGREGPYELLRHAFQGLLSLLPVRHHSARGAELRGAVGEPLAHLKRLTNLNGL